MNAFIGMGLALLLTSPLLQAQAPGQVQTPTFQAAVTRKGNNLYQIDGKDLLVLTQNCNLQAYAEDVLLKASGTGGDITFVYSKDKCELRGVYGPTPPVPGQYTITVSQKADNWFEIFGTNTFLKTRECRVMVLGEEAMLTFRTAGPGQLRFKDKTTCAVEALYGKRRL